MFCGFFGILPPAKVFLLLLCWIVQLIVEGRLLRKIRHHLSESSMLAVVIVSFLMPVKHSCLLRRKYFVAFGVFFSVCFLRCYFICMVSCLHVCVCVTYILGAHRGQKSVSGLQLDYRSLCVQNRTWVFWKCSSPTERCLQPP